MENSIPWIEKYRPKHIDDVILNKDVEKLVKSFLDERRGIHIIICGVPGIGKTSTVRCMAKYILGDNMKDGYLELNAADDRGVKIISNIIPPFCKKVVSFDCPKIILLDEADNLTHNCQNDIDNMIEKYGNNTKFMFTCNDSKKINEDIQSVCRIIHFNNPPKESVKKYLCDICDKESIKYQEDGIEMIYYVSGFDVRKSVNDLQKTAYSLGKITKKSVANVCNIPDPDIVKNIIEMCFTGSIIEVNNAVINLVDKGHVFSDIINSFSYIIINMDNISESTRVELIDIVYQLKITTSSKVKSRLQLSAMIANIYGKLTEIL